MEKPGDVFDRHQEAWAEYRQSPWGRLRYELVALRLREVIGDEPRRILDVGGGDGGDALPLAERGHDITLLDSSPAMLIAASSAGLRAVAGTLDDELPTGFDVVLCHYVLQYRKDLSADLAKLAAAIVPGGLLSVIVPTAPGTLLAAAARRGLAGASELLENPTMRAVAFESDVRRFQLSEVRDAFAQVGLNAPDLFGIRVINDLVLDDDSKHDASTYKELLRLETKLSPLPPYNEIGVHTQFVGEKPLA